MLPRLFLPHIGRISITSFWKNFCNFSKLVNSSCTICSRIWVICPDCNYLFLFLLNQNSSLLSGRMIFQPSWYFQSLITLPRLIIILPIIIIALPYNIASTKTFPVVNTTKICAFIQYFSQYLFQNYILCFQIYCNVLGYI